MEDFFASYDPQERDWLLEGYFEPGSEVSMVSDPDGRPARGFKDLWVWAQGMALTTTIYSLTRNFPKDEMYGLTSQLRRAAVSVPSNLAEGWARNKIGFLQLGLTYARGSAAEIETQLLIAVGQGYLTEADSKPVIDLLNGLSTALLKFIVSLELKKKNR
ncbi:MAG: four helix bundle protein [Flavobacteriales bacterium]